MTAAIDLLLHAHPLYERIEGAPYQPGERVAIVAAIDREAKDVSEWIHCVGIVEYLEYECGCGQTFPTDPMIGVRFAGGALEEFWREELRPFVAGAREGP